MLWSLPCRHLSPFNFNKNWKRYKHKQFFIPSFILLMSTTISITWFGRIWQPIRTYDSLMQSEMLKKKIMNKIFYFVLGQCMYLYSHLHLMGVEHVPSSLLYYSFSSIKAYTCFLFSIHKINIYYKVEVKLVLLSWCKYILNKIKF